MYTFDEIVGIVKQRQQNGSVLLERMLEVKERYRSEEHTSELQSQ